MSSRTGSSLTCRGEWFRARRCSRLAGRRKQVCHRGLVRLGYRRRRGRSDAAERERAGALSLDQRPPRCWRAGDSPEELPTVTWRNLPVSVTPVGMGASCTPRHWPGRVPDRAIANSLGHRTACKALGSLRLCSLTIHYGCHTFTRHALVGGRTLAEARDAVGHGNVTITSGYLHAAIDDCDEIGRLFGL